MKITEQAKAVILAAEKQAAKSMAIRNATAHNRFLTSEYLAAKTLEEIMCFMHPIERRELKSKLNVKSADKFDNIRHS